jgi:peptide/nickel transport system substrate-binding protein
MHRTSWVGVLFAGLLILMLLSISCANTAPTSTTAPVATSPSKAAPPSITSSTIKPSVVPEYGGILKILTATSPINMGLPWEINLPDDTVLARPAVENLVGLDSEGKGTPIPQLAASWQYGTDSKTLTFKLRQGVKFQDGTDFNADAAKYCLDMYRNSSKPELKIVSSIDIVDNYTVRLNLTSFDPALLNNLAQSGGKMVSPTNAKTLGKDAMMRPVGTGPYKFVSYSKDVSVKFERFDGYWGGRPYLDGIEYDISVDPSTSLMAFKAGDAQVLRRVSPKDANDLKAQGFVLASTGSNILGIAGDSKNPDSPFANIKIRQAISYAIDTNAIAKTIGYGFFPATNQWAMPNSQGYNSTVVGYPYNVQKAKQLLTEAGYPNGMNTKITYDSGGSSYKDVFTAVQDYLSVIGIKTEVEGANAAKISDLTSKGWNNQLVSYRLNLSIGYDLGGSLKGLLSSKASNWVSVGIPADYDAKLTQINTEPDPVKREAQLEELSKMIIDTYCIVTPFYISSSITANYTKVHDLDMLKYAGVEWLPQKVWLSK